MYKLVASQEDQAAQELIDKYLGLKAIQKQILEPINVQGIFASRPSELAHIEHQKKILEETEGITAHGSIDMLCAYGSSCAKNPITVRVQEKIIDEKVIPKIISLETVVLSKKALPAPEMLFDRLNALLKNNNVVHRVQNNAEATYVLTRTGLQMSVYRTRDVDGYNTLTVTDNETTMAPQKSIPYLEQFAEFVNAYGQII